MASSRVGTGLTLEHMNILRDSLEEPQRLLVDDSGDWLDALQRARIVADPRKFREHVLVPGHPSGKDGIFLGRLGFRPRSASDSWELARLYEAGAREQVAVGAVERRRVVPDGIPCTIVIAVRGVRLRTGWILEEEVLRLITPFSGFARRTSED